MPALLLALLCLLPRAAAANPDRDLEFYDFERASLEETLNVRTAVASRLDFTAREAPGIVTVITRAEILNSGARDLADVLRLAPGLDLGVDVESSIGLGVRGNWAYEGKVLLLVDGQRYNEPFFGTVQLRRIPVEQIEKVEIIRGPGSAVYGGFAGLGVIKIDTRGARSLSGGEAAVSLGAMSRGGSAAGAGLAYGRQYQDYEFSVLARADGQDRSDRRYTDFSGGSYSMKGASDLRARNFNAAAKTPWFDARFIADLYRTAQRDHYDTTSLSRPLDRNFDAYFAGLSRELHPAEHLSLTPSLNYAFQEPFSGYDAAEYPRDKASHSSRCDLVAVYAPPGGPRLSAGAEYSVDKAVLADTTPAAWYFKGGRRSVKYSNTAVFLETSAGTPLGQFSAGARYDDHDEFLPAFSPRLAWSKVLGAFHVKGIHSRSFRAPGIDNLDANPDLKPEKVTVTELEAGYKITGDLFVSANLYNIRIKDPIVFYVENSVQKYGNYGRTGTRGCELAARLKKDWGYADLSYSRYDAASNSVDFYSAGAAGALLAFARDKIALNSSFRLSGKVSVNPSAVYYGGRRGYRPDGNAGPFEDLMVTSLNLSVKELAAGRLELGLAVHDIFNSGYSYLQPYNGGHAALPAQSREVRARLAYKF